MKETPFEAADEALLNHGVRASRDDLPDDAQMRRLERVLAPVLVAKATPARWYLRPQIWIAAVAISATFAGVTRGLEGFRATDGKTPAASAPPASPPAPLSLTHAVDVPSPAMPTMPTMPTMPGVSVDSLPTAIVPARPAREAKAGAVKPGAVGAIEVKPDLAPEGQSEGASEASTSTEALANELVLLEAARRALVTDPTRTLTLADEHAKRFQRPSFAQERERLAIDALVRLGRRADAAKRAQLFEATFPDSAHLKRVRALVATPPEAAP